jgi:hypothetical protein
MLGLQAFNTHGTEIAPGSDIVAENLDMERGHIVPVCYEGLFIKRYLLSAIDEALSIKRNL